MATDQKTIPHSPQRYAYIDALRGYAILAVILVHVQGPFPLPEFLKTIFSQGARGVQLFFVLSAFTLMLSWHARGNHPMAFYIRRFFRIAPLFWLAIVVYSYLQGMEPNYWAPNGMNWRIILATFLFVHGWHLEAINSVVPGGWSIAVEMNFYLLFPLIARYLNSFKRTFIALVIVTVAARFSNVGIQHVLSSFIINEPDYMVSSYAMLWFFNQLPSFATGMLVYYSLKNTPQLSQKFSTGILVFALLYILYLCFHISPNYLYYFSFAFGVALFAIAQGGGKLLINRFAIFTGKVSYSAYLCQFIIIDHIYKWLIAQKFAVADLYPIAFFIGVYISIVLTVLAISYILHLAIEKPMINLGHRLAKHYA